MQSSARALRLGLWATGLRATVVVVDPDVILRLARASGSDFRASVLGSNVRFDPPAGTAHLAWKRGIGLDWIDADGRVVRRIVSPRFPAISLVNGIDDLPPTKPAGSPRWIAGWRAHGAARRRLAERELGDLLGEIDRAAGG